MQETDDYMYKGEKDKNLILAQELIAEIQEEMAGLRADYANAETDGERKNIEQQLISANTRLSNAQTARDSIVDNMREQGKIK